MRHLSRWVQLPINSINNDKTSRENRISPSIDLRLLSLNALIAEYRQSDDISMMFKLVFRTFRDLMIDLRSYKHLETENGDAEQLIETATNLRRTDAVVDIRNRLKIRKITNNCDKYRINDFGRLA